MPSVKGLRRRISAYRPRIQSAYVMYLEPLGTVIDDPDPSFEMRMVTSPDDPILPRLVPRFQMKAARESLAAGRWRCLIGLDGERVVARLWLMTGGEERRLFTGNPRVRLTEKELYFFDLYIEPDYRRGGLARTMADYFMREYDPAVNKVDYAYSWIAVENGASAIWHYTIGFNILQSVNFFQCGPRIKWKIPLSDMPRFGPFSRKGRHTDPEQRLFGPSVLPHIVPPLSARESAELPR